MTLKTSFLTFIILASSYANADSNLIEMASQKISKINQEKEKQDQIFQDQYQGKFRTLGDDEYISELLRDSAGQVKFVSNLQTASKMCADLQGRVPSAPDIMTDSQRRDMGVSFKRLRNQDFAKIGYWRPISDSFDEKEIYYQRLARLEIFDSNGFPSIYYFGFQNYDLNEDQYGKYSVWTTNKIVKFSDHYAYYNIGDLKEEDFVPVAAVAGGFDRIREDQVAVRCVVPKLVSSGSSTQNCRDVSAFAVVGTHCTTSKKIEVTRVLDRETGLLGWQESSEGIIFLDASTPQDQKNDTFQKWSRNCKSKIKGSAKVDLPTIDELMKLKTHGLNEILNETKSLWAKTITPLATRPKLYRDVYSSLQGLPTIDPMDSGDVAGRCIIRMIK